MGQRKAKAKERFDLARYYLMDMNDVAHELGLQVIVEDGDFCAIIDNAGKFYISAMWGGINANSIELAGASEYSINGVYVSMGIGQARECLEACGFAVAVDIDDGGKEAWNSQRGYWMVDRELVYYYFTLDESDRVASIIYGEFDGGILVHPSDYVYYSDGNEGINDYGLIDYREAMVFFQFYESYIECLNDQSASKLVCSSREVEEYVKSRFSVNRKSKYYLGSVYLEIGSYRSSGNQISLTCKCASTAVDRRTQAEQVVIAVWDAVIQDGVVISAKRRANSSQQVLGALIELR
ncbi:MAG: hypothetical protein FWG10_07745 [Eubacteriaceae bacterium]|nr:hypothetical protein [Eubacteriaceae bacterium]